MSSNKRILAVLAVAVGSILFSIIPSAASAATTATTLSITGSNPIVVTYPATSTSISATLKTSGIPGTDLNNKVITFTANGVVVGSSTTNTSGLATLNNVNLSGVSTGTHSQYFVANFAGDASDTASTANAGLTINPKALTITGLAVNSKIYDKTTAATFNVTSAGLSGVVGSDTVTLAVSASSSISFTSDSVGNNKSVNVSGFSLSGASAGNYSLTTTNITTTAAITAAPLTVIGTTASNKVYDGSTTSTINTASSTLSGVISGDTVTLTKTNAKGTFSDKNIGSGKVVTFSGFSISGLSATDYSLVQPTSTANITALPITVTAATNTKTYDGTTSAAAIPALTSSTLATGDTANFTEAYNDPTVGTGKTLIPSGTVNDGNTGANYSVTFVDNTTGVITAATSTTPTSTPPTTGGGSDLNCTLPTSGNLVPNPAMTQSSTFSGVPHCWASGGYGTNTSAWSYPVAGPTGGSEAAQVSISNYQNGAAEWYFQNTPVTPGALYTFSDSYESNVDSELIAQWTLTDGSLAYDALGTLPSTNSAWATSPQEVFNAPLNAASVTILHLIETNGTLATSNYSFASYASSDTNGFSKALVSLTFDDGWESQYNNGLPILTAANMPGTFYIITEHIGATGQNLFDTSDVSTSTMTTNSAAIWSGLYVDPTAPEYLFTDTYSATAPTTITANYTLNGSPASTTIGTLPATGSATSANFTFDLPVNAANASSSSSTVTPISISQTLDASGTLTASNPSLIEYPPYMSPAQLLTLQSDGEDVGNHTVNHCDLTTGLCPDVSPTTHDSLSVADEINEAKTTLQGWGIAPVTTFAYPFGDYNTSVENVLNGDAYANARTVDVGYNTVGYNPLALKTYSVVASTTFSQVQSWIDTAIANKWWLVLTFHDVDPANILAANNEVYGTTPQILQQIVSYLQTQETGGSVSVANMANATPTSTPPTAPSIAISPATLSPATVGAPYLATLTASTTATGIFNWTVASGTGTLPPGLALNTSSTGATTTISGTPTAAGSSTFSIMVTNGTGSSTASSTQSYTLTIAATPTITIAPTSTTLSNATVGMAYGPVTISATSNSSDTIAFATTTESLPAGLELVNNGNGTMTLSGTPTATGIATFAVNATDTTDAASAPASSTYSFNVTAQPTVTIAPAPPTLPDAQVGSAYSQTITASDINASDTFTWTIATDTLSSDFAITTSTTGVVTIMGTPSATGAYKLAVTAASNATGVANGTSGTTPNIAPASADYTLTVDAAPTPAPTPTPTPAPAVVSGGGGSGSVSGGGGGGGGGGGASAFVPIPTASTSTSSSSGGVVLGASTTNELALLQSLLTQLLSLEQQLVTMEFKQNGCPATFTTNLSQGTTDPQVEALQKVLNYSSVTQVAQTGAGSPGDESTYFGAATKAAVATFQNIFADEILAPNGLTSGNGYVGAATRAELNALCSQ